MSECCSASCPMLALGASCLQHLPAPLQQETTSWNAGYCRALRCCTVSASTHRQIVSFDRKLGAERTLLAGGCSISRQAMAFCRAAKVSCSPQGPLTQDTRRLHPLAVD